MAWTSSAGASLVDVEALARWYGPRRAVDGVSFSLGAGECLAVFGPNGAGKTTLLRVLAGLLKPSAGRARLDGTDLPGDPAIRSRIGMISHQGMLYDALTARENVEFAARLHGVPGPRAAALGALERMRMGERAESPVRRLSRGMRQRVAIARAVVHEPRVLLLDEPYSGLDDAGAAALTGMLAHLRTAGAALVLVTHNLGEGLELASRVAVMRAGRFVVHQPRSAVEPAGFVELYRGLVT